MLTDAQRKELEAMGAPNVRSHMTGWHGGGRNSVVPGFQCGDITRGDIYDWLSEKDAQDAARESATLRWARIAGWASIIGIAVAVLAIVLPLLGSK